MRRGTLYLNLKDLDEEGLIKRRVVTTKPIQSYYSLTEKGGKIAEMRKTKIISQRIIAHVLRPTDHIIIMSTLD